MYDGHSFRIASLSYPNGQMTEYQYGSVSQDKLLQRITHKSGATPISEFIYDYNFRYGQITTWSQQSGNEASQPFTVSVTTPRIN